MVLLYVSKIRPINTARSHFNTTLSGELLEKIKEIAKKEDTSYNFILEEGMEWILETYYLKGSFHKSDKPADRVRINTTFDTSLFNRVKARGKRLGKMIYANDLIEEGMSYIIDKRNNNVE
ncbi:hypothetical protein [Viridibacillus arvi]|uniref:hypothetical protein n=1 Tax=Viridibacillus arvi TaxID=263475 RepID=UPI0034D00DE0